MSEGHSQIEVTAERSSEGFLKLNSGLNFLQHFSDNFGFRISIIAIPSTLQISADC